MVKKIFILFLIFIVIAFAKVKKIDDEFDGTYYYQTGHYFIMSSGLKMFSAPEYRFRTTKEKYNHSIMMELNAFFGGVTVVNNDDKVRIKCNNENIVVLDYEYTISRKGASFGFVSSEVEAMRCSAILTEADIEALLSGVNMIRVEAGKSFINIAVSKNDSKKLIKTLEELIKKLEDNKKR